LRKSATVINQLIYIFRAIAATSLLFLSRSRTFATLVLRTSTLIFKLNKILAATEAIKYVIGYGVA